MEDVVEKLLDKAMPVDALYSAYRDLVFRNFRTLFFEIYALDLPVLDKVFAMSRFGMLARILRLREGLGESDYPLDKQLTGLMEMLSKVQYLLAFPDVPLNLWKDFLTRGLDLIAVCLKEDRVADWQNDPQCQTFLKEYSSLVAKLRGTGKYTSLMEPLGR